MMAALRNGSLRLISSRIIVTRFNSTHNLDQYPTFIKSSSPEEWIHVENLMPKKYVPNPSIKEEYPSGWKPQTASSEENKYFIERNKNHMLPIYLDISHRGLTKITTIKNIQGDIWLMKKELDTLLKQRYPNIHYPIQLHEICRTIKIKGDFVNLLKEMFLNKGF